MYVVEDFHTGYPPDSSCRIECDELSISDQHTSVPHFDLTYSRNFSSRLEVVADMPLNEIFGGDFVARVSGKDFGQGVDFFPSKRRWGAEGGIFLSLRPKREPFLLGEDASCDKVQAVVVNGPNLFFSEGSLDIDFGEYSVSYKNFESIREMFDNSVFYKNEKLATGLLTIATQDAVGFRFEAAWKVLWSMSQCLSLMKGGGVGVGHFQGSQNGKRRYVGVGFSKSDQFEIPSGWFDIEIVPDLPDFFQCFWRYKEREPEGMPLLYAWDFYRSSNSIRDTSAEMAVISSYSALEVLVYHILRERAGWSNSLLSLRSPFSDKLRAAMGFVGLEVEPLEFSPELQKKSRRFNGADFFWMLSETRNSIVHADKNFKLNGLELLEVWMVSQWMCEVLIFYLIGYRGKMADRRRYQGWRGEGVGPVPVRRFGGA